MSAIMELENASQENISFLELEEALECVVCLFIPASSPVHQCDIGHLLCSNCRSRLVECPICRTKLGSTRSLFAEKMLGKIPDRCPFASIGCRAKMSSYDVENHVKECNLREVVCPSRACKQRIRFGFLVSTNKSKLDSRKGCCVFWPSSRCCAYKKSLLKYSFQPFLFILNLFQWFHAWNHWKTSENEHVFFQFLSTLKAGRHAKAVPWICLFSVDFFTFLTFFVSFWLISLKKVEN